MIQATNRTFDKATFLGKVYGLMFLSLALSMATAYSARTKVFTVMANSNQTALWLGSLVVMLVLVWVLSKYAIEHPLISLVGLLAFSVLNGLLISTIFVEYPVKLIADAFLTASADFGVMSFIGLTTKKELNWGRQLFGAMVALIIVSIINLFWFNSLVMMVFSAIGVVVFSLYTAYDSQKIVEIAERVQKTNGVVVFGALSLYLDFVNLFLDLLNLFAGGNSLRN